MFSRPPSVLNGKNKMSHLQPKSCSFANSSQLSRLIMGKSKSRKVLIRLRKFGETIDHYSKSTEQQVAAFSKKDQVRIIGHIARRRAEVDNGRRCRCYFSKRVNVRHHVMSPFLFLLSRNSELSFIEVLEGKEQ